MTAFNITVDTAGLDAKLDSLATRCEEAARPAAQAAAQLLYDAVLRNAPQSRKGHWFYGTNQRYYFEAGSLRRAIYQVFNKKLSSTAKAVYEVSWNTKKAPYAWMVEFGYPQKYEVSYDPKTGRFTTHRDRPLPTPRHVAARPFMRPARALLPQAQQAMRDRYLSELRARGVLK